MDKKPIILVSLSIACSLAADSMLYIVLPVYWQEAGLNSLWEVGILLSVNRFIRLPLNPVIGFIYSKIEIRKGLFIASILAVLTSLGYMVSSGFWVWLILRSVWGIAWALFSLGGLLTVLKHARQDNRGELMGNYNGLYRLGSLVGMLLGGILPGLVGFKKTTFFFAFLSFFSLIFVGKMDSLGEGSLKPQKKIVFRNLFLGPVLIVLATGFVINMLYRGVINSTLSLIIADNFGLNIQIFGFIIGATVLAGFLQALRWIWEPFLASAIGKYSDGAWGRRPLLIVSLVIASGSFLLSSFRLPLNLWLAVICLLLLSATSLTTLSDTLATDVAKDIDPVSIMTSYIIANDVGAALGPLLIYQLLNFEQGIVIGFYISALLLLILAFGWQRYQKIFLK